jgi:hypothetical protein
MWGIVEVDQSAVVWRGVYCRRKGIELEEAGWLLKIPYIITVAVVLIKSRA